MLVIPFQDKLVGLLEGFLYFVFSLLLDARRSGCHHYSNIRR